MAADLKLKRVVIRNWMKFDRAEIEFPASGLVLVTGVNKASGGKMSSVGSGKTAFGEAICRTLLGSRGRFTQPRSFSRDKKGDCYVRVEAEHRGVPLIVENGYKATAEFPESSGEGLRYKYGDKPAIERSRMEETRDEIAAILGVTPLLSNWTVFIRGKKIEFSDLSQEDAVNLIMAALMQPPWTQFFERSKAVVANFKNTVENDQNNHAATLKRIEGAKISIQNAEASVTAEEKVYNEQRSKNDERIKQLDAESATKKQLSEKAGLRKVAIKKRLDEIEAEKAQKQHELEIERNKIDDKIFAAGQRRDAAVEKRSTAKNTFDNATAKLEELEGTPKDCPSCGKPWDKAHGETEIAKQKAAVEKAEKAYKAKAADVDKINKEISSLQAERRTVSGNINALSVKADVNALSDEYEQLDIDDKARDRRIHAIELEIVGLKKDVSDAAVKEAKATLAERKRHLAELEEQLKKLATSVSEAQEASKVVGYWNKAFSPTGIPNMVLAEAIGPMNQVAKTISHRMTGGTIHVTYATTKQLVSGASKAELQINVVNDIGSSEIQGSSNGEGGLTNFIVAETLSEVGNVSQRVGFRWYDEVVPYQDPVVAKSIYAYMREVAHRLGILVFLVDHNPVAENFADHILVIEKSRGGTTAGWR
jgi:DNA repair exonuclease SbcCD ATPase subunit